MESFAYILILAFALGTLFFAVALRDPPKIGK
ncbi:MULTISPECIES: photosystem II reaction center protein T [Synechococcus]|jgi:photosystem II PsbT protein|nr:MULTISPECIES: photosystem II reaction center protein T [Synechococcus]NBV58803.1 photosystem II reaction center protein T [Synechococcaceae bacterium WB4_2_0811]NBV69353.1 photosystem II reaction center protein T [Synechococcaceae bacterium WB4_2_0805]NCU92075.1 photosystem II reaction center protein T [Synechococcaceae bacterium WB7_1B_046]OON12276.1 MAG: photosystem II reaction center protein T [Synechococcus lacustris str. Tous]HBU27067.1 photosystem II reaction center protein T [Synecho